MSINIEDYPRLIAAPFKQTLVVDLQQKEYQRITLEMILSLNATACLSAYYALKKSGKGQKLGPLDLDLGQMSIGKWNAFNRHVSKVLKAESKDSVIGEIYELYHGSQKGKWTTVVDELIKRRNKDAHGEVISSSQLPDELRERQEMIDQLMELLSFYKDYRLIVPYDDKVKEGKVIYLCKDLSGVDEKLLSIENSPEELEVYRPYFFNLSSRETLPLLPMIVCHPQSDETKDIRAFVYSKTLNKKTGNLHYSSWESSKDFESGGKTAPGDFLSPSQICREFEAFRAYVEDPSLVYQKQPSISIERAFGSSTIGVGETAALRITIKNEGDADALDVSGVLNFPAEGFLLVDEEDNELAQNSVEILIPLLGQGEVWDQAYHFKSKDSGQYEFDPFMLSYSYVNIRNESILPDTENGINVETSPALLYSVFDPNDPESQMPIININMSYDNETPQIGDNITLNIDVKNIGRSVANDVDISILPPKDQIELLSGSPDWRGTINPGQSVKSQFILLPKTHGVFTMKMRDIVYRNQVGDLFKTLAYEDYKILVRNNPKVRYRFLMEEIWEDLVVDQEEEDQINLFARQYEITPEEKKNIESEVKIKIIKRLVKDMANRSNLKIREVARDGMYAFCLGPCPFLVLDFSDMENIKLLLKGKFKGPEFETLRAGWRSRFREVPFSMFPLSELTNIGGSNRLKGMINQALRWVDQHEYLLALLADNITDLLSIRRESIDTLVEGGYIGYQPNTDTADSLVANGFYTYFDQKGAANLIGSYPQSSGIGKLLKDKGFQFARKNDFASDQPFEKQDRVTTFVHIDSLKINKGNKTGLLNKMQEYVLTCIDLASAQVIDQFKEKESIKDSLNIIEEIVSKNVANFLCRVDPSKKTMTYYLGREFPLFQPGNDILQVSIKKNTVVASLRILDKGIYEELEDAVTIQKAYWPYVVEVREETMDLLSKAVIEAGHTGQEFQDLSYGFLRGTLENLWISSFDLILRELHEKKMISFQEGNEFFEKNNIKTKINAATRAINNFYNNHKIESPIDTNYAEETLTTKEKYAEIINAALEDYSIKVDDDKLAFHDFKLLINKLNEDRATMAYLTRVVFTRTIISSEKFKSAKGIFFDITLSSKSKLVRLTLSINNNEYAEHVKSSHENLLSESIQGIEGKEIILGSVKGGKENSYKISLQFPLDDIAQMKDKDWVNNFVGAYNQFVEIFLKKDADTLRLHYLE